MEELKEGWRIVKLGEVADILNGYAFKANDFKEIGIPVVKIKNITPPKVSLKDIQFVSEELYNEKIKYRLNFDDILISMTGSHASQPNSIVGRVARIKEKNTKILINQRVGKIYPRNQECNQAFLYYYLAQDFIKFELAASAGGSASQANINPNQIKELEIYLPPLETQQKIASILSSLDDKIELSNEMNKTLEEMAQTLFKRWFIDFEFPNENGEPFRSSGGKMVESELGEIPEGWDLKKLNELCNIEKGLSYKGKHLCEKDGIPMVNLGSVQPGGGYREDKIKFYNGDFKPKNTVKAGDIIIANTDMTQERIILGSPFIVPKFLGNTIIFTHHLYSITNMKLPSTFLYCYFQEKKFREMCESCATGTTVLSLPKSDVLNILMIAPPEKIVSNFDSIVKTMFESMELNLDKIRNLTQLRDNLLPKLMSGEIKL